MLGLKSIQCFESIKCKNSEGFDSSNIQYKSFVLTNIDEINYLLTCLTKIW